MIITCGDSEIALLASVVKRAFDDIELRYKSSGSVTYAKKAVDWITGSCIEEGYLDDFMSFRSICETLGWPEKELIALAHKLYEGEYDSVKRVGSELLLPYRGRETSSQFDARCDVFQCESLLRDILFDAPSSVECDPRD